MKTLKESDIEDYLVKRVRAMGGEVRKVKWIGRKSAPDRVVMMPPYCPTPTQYGYNILPGGTTWVELKRPGLCATFPKDAHERAQYREHERMRRVGQRVVVIDSFQGVDELLS